jgi:adenine-specific DNA-methyltransferase
MQKVHKDRAIGQYWTPQLIAEFMLEVAGFDPLWKVIDPSCGEGVFLEAALRRGAVAVTGIDIDPQVIEKVRQRFAAYPVQPRLYCQDGLLPVQDPNPFWQGEYDLVVGNPPYASVGYRIRNPAILHRFELSREAIKAESPNLFPDLPLYKRKESVPIEVLFIERAFQLAKWGGKVILILPAGFFAGKKLRYARQYLFSRYAPLLILELPKTTFEEVGTNAHTIILYAHKRPAAPHQEVLLGSLPNLQYSLDTPFPEAPLLHEIAAGIRREIEVSLEETGRL